MSAGAPMSPVMSLSRARVASDDDAARMRLRGSRRATRRKVSRITRPVRIPATERPR